MMDHTASSTMDPFCTGLTNRIVHSSLPEKHKVKKGGSLNRTDIVEYTRNHGGGADLPRKTFREALDLGFFFLFDQLL